MISFSKHEGKSTVRKVLFTLIIIEIKRISINLQLAAGKALMEAVILKGYPLTHKNHPRHTKQDEKGRKNLPRERLRKEICLVIEQRGRRVSEAQRKQEKQYK